jgi:hypothetical protein
VKDFGGIVRVCKNIALGRDGCGLTEGDITAVATAEACKRYTGVRPDSAFAKFCAENPVVLRACDIAKQSAFASFMTKDWPEPMSLEPTQVGGVDALHEVSDDESSAYKKLMEMADKQRRADESAAQAFQRVYLDPANKHLAQAERRENRPQAR